MYHNLQGRVTRTLLHAFLDPKKALTQHYGAIRGLAALGSRVVCTFTYGVHLIKSACETLFLKHMISFFFDMLIFRISPVDLFLG